jgi:outer membrane lipoprotein-sorting protein
MFRPIPFILVLLLCACAPKLPPLPETEVPAGPLLQALDKRQQSFRGLTAMASVEFHTGHGRRTFDSVGVVLDGQRRLRMEAYGPLGQTITALVWNGNEVLLLLPGNDKVVRQGADGLARIFGDGLDAKELCALLSNNVPDALASAKASLFCEKNNECVLELRRMNDIRRVYVSPATGSEKGPVILMQERYQDGALLYRARFGRSEVMHHYRLPLRIELEKPDQDFVLTIEYSEVELNPKISNEAFILLDER